MTIWILDTMILIWWYIWLQWRVNISFCIFYEHPNKACIADSIIHILYPCTWFFFGLNVQRMCVTCCAQLDLISRCPKMSQDGRQLFSQMFQTYHLALGRFWRSSRVSMKDNWWQLTLLLSSCCAKIVGKNAAGVWRETVSANFSLLSHGHCHVICLFTKFIFGEDAFSIGVREIVFLSSLYATDRL